MAVYTHLSDAQIGQVAEAYGLGGVISCKGIAQGVENSNFILITDLGKYVLTIYEARTNRKDLPFFMSLMRHLHARDIPCPTPLLYDGDSAIYHMEIDGQDKAMAVTSFLDGRDIGAISKEHCFEVGRALAQMHIATSSFDGTRANDLSLTAWRRQARELLPRAGSIMRREYIAEVEHFLQYLEDNQHLMEGCRTGVIHGDLFPDNVFFTGGRITGVLDLYFACNDAYIYDLAITLNAWCFEHETEYNMTKGTALLRGYDGVLPITEEERGALAYAACGAAMRFFLTRLESWLTPAGDGRAVVTPKNPQEYLEKLRFHSHADSFHAYGL